MTDDDTLGSCTTICVRKLSKGVDEKFLEFYFRSRLDPPKCGVKLFPDPKSESERNYAFIDVGLYEKVQQAIREVNGAEVDGQHISVFLSIKDFSPSPGKKVYLKQFSKGVDTKDLYDLLSKFGTIVGIEITYDRIRKHKLFSACATYLTVEQAQHAIQMIMSLRQSEQSLIATADKDYNPDSQDDVGTPEPQEGFYEVVTPRSRSRSRSNRRVSFADRNNTIVVDDAGLIPKSPPQAQQQGDDGSSSVLPEAADNLATQVHESRAGVDGASQSASIDSAKETLHQDKSSDIEAAAASSPTLGQPALDFTNCDSEVDRKQAVHDFLFHLHKDQFKPKLRVAKILEVLFKSLELQHIIENCMKTERFQLYADFAETAMKNGKMEIDQLSNAALDAAEEMELAAVQSYTEKLRMIREHLYYRGIGRYSHKILNKILDRFMDQLDMQRLLEIYADEKCFRMWALYARLAIEKNTELTPRSFPEPISELILQLELDKPDSTAQSIAKYKQALRAYLTAAHQERYGSEQLSKILDKVFQSTALPSNIFDLLEFCADEKRFRLMAYQAKLTIGKNSELAPSSLLESMSQCISQVSLDKPNCAAQSFWCMPILLKRLVTDYNNPLSFQVPEKQSDPALRTHWDQVREKEDHEFHFYASVRWELHALKVPVGWQSMEINTIAELLSKVSGIKPENLVFIQMARGNNRYGQRFFVPGDIVHRLKADSNVFQLWSDFVDKQDIGSVTKTSMLVANEVIPEHWIQPTVSPTAQVEPSTQELASWEKAIQTQSPEDIQAYVDQRDPNRRYFVTINVITSPNLTNEIDSIDNPMGLPVAAVAKDQMQGVREGCLTTMVLPVTKSMTVGVFRMLLAREIYYLIGQSYTRFWHTKHAKGTVDASKNCSNGAIFHIILRYVASILPVTFGGYRNNDFHGEYQPELAQWLPTFDSNGNDVASVENMNANAVKLRDVFFFNALENDGQIHLDINFTRCWVYLRGKELRHHISMQSAANDIPMQSVGALGDELRRRTLANTADRALQ